MNEEEKKLRNDALAVLTKCKNICYKNYEENCVNEECPIGDICFNYFNDAPKGYNLKNFFNISNDTKVILKNIDPEYKWIAKDECDRVYVFTKKPCKNLDAGEWELNFEIEGARQFGWFEMFKQDLFDFLSWEDEEPMLIADLIKED